MLRWPAYYPPIRNLKSYLHMYMINQSQKYVRQRCENIYLLTFALKLSDKPCIISVSQAASEAAVVGDASGSSRVTVAGRAVRPPSAP